MDDFHQLSSSTLNHLVHFFDTVWAGADVDLFEDALHVILKTGHQYVINKHGVTQQLWLSSPFTGAHHFRHEHNVWRCTRTGIPLEDLLKNEHEIYAA